MKITHDGRYFVAESTYQEKDALKEAGFWWNKFVPGKWATPDPEKAARLREHVDESAAAVLNRMLAKKDEAIEASKATNATIDIPAPEGLAYLPFQKAGIAYASQRPATLIADEMGLGKTIQAIGVINMDPEIKTALVICPASLKVNWHRELTKWLTRPFKIGIVNGEWQAWDIYIMNYDILKKWADFLRVAEFDLLICDEAHYLKNPKAQRTNQVLGKWDKDPEKIIPPIRAKRKLFLTGTPIVNRPIELWPMVHSLQRDSLGKSWKWYVTRYCAGYQDRHGWNVSGASNLGELQERLRASLMVRRLKKDVLTELPPKRRQVIELPANGCSDVIENEKSAWQAHEERLSELKAQVELSKASDNPGDYEQAVLALREGAQTAFAEISRLRHETALAKIPSVLEHLKETLEAIDKIVLFCHHKDVVATIQTELGASCVVLTGDMNQTDRQESVDRFQNDSEVKVFIGTIGAAGVGITLTAASHVIFAELDWTPGAVTQAEDRTHRIGQINPVLIQHLVLQDSLDARMAHILVAKQAVIDAALDKDIPKSEPVIPTAGTCATESISRERVEKEAPNLTSDQIQAIHEALRIVAGMCDGARDLDGMGFSKIDVRVGHSLAHSKELTQKQAALGKRIVWKYKRQFGVELLARIKGEEQANE